jgi:hypothetical protein
MRSWIKLVGISLLLMLAGCATTPQQPPQIQRISPEELEQIIPKPVPNLTLEEIVHLSKNTPPELLIEKIKASNSQYDLTPSQVVDLSKKGVDAKVLDYIHASREQALRDSFADEINKREKARLDEQEKLKREYQLLYQQYYDPFWGYGCSPYFGPSFRYRRW